MFRVSILTLALSWLLFITDPISAHGTGWNEEKDTSVNLAFYYSDGTPMSFCDIEIKEPLTGKIHQKARTDINGYFSFRPDHQGTWTFEVNDGQGHLSSGQVNISPEAKANEGEPSESSLAPVVNQHRPDVSSFILGLSLIFNLGLGSWLACNYRSNKFVK